MCMDHLVTHQLLPISVLTIMDTSDDKMICIVWKEHHVKCWSEPEYENNDIHVYAFVSYGSKDMIY